MSEHNHELQAGMELIDEYGATIQIDDVHDDGSVSATEIREDGFQDEHEWSQEEVCNSLVDGNLETDDGRSHELVRNF